MGKKIVFFLLVVAAVLLAIPAGAQTAVAKKAAYSAAMKAPKVLQARDAAFARAAEAKANEKLVVAEGKQFASAVAAQAAQVRPSKSDAYLGGVVYNWPTAPKTPAYVSRSGIIGNGKTPCGTLPNLRKMELFQLDLSFLGWIVLAGLPYIGFVAGLWFTPYYTTTLALYYERLSGHVTDGAA